MISKVEYEAYLERLRVEKRWAELAEELIFWCQVCNVYTMKRHWCRVRD